MDIASRLKKFLDATGMPSTQFADTCGIPRPSFSQILSGRNKKISDEVIGKIHAAFPNLSVMWLMFSEGDMLLNGNMQTSEHQNSAENTENGQEITEDELIGSTDIFFEPAPVNFQSGNSGRRESTPSPAESEIPLKREGHQAPTAQPATSMTMKVNSERRVVNIMVFYSDSSFETFVPKAI